MYGVNKLIKLLDLLNCLYGLYAAVVLAKMAKGVLKRVIYRCKSPFKDGNHYIYPVLTIYVDQIYPCMCMNRKAAEPELESLF